MDSGGQRQRFLADLDAKVAAYDPVKPFLKENTILGEFERGLYSAPGAIAYTVQSAIPYYGQVWSFNMLRRDSYQSTRQRLVAEGHSRAFSADVAERIALPAAAIQYPLDRLGLHALKGKVPWLSGVMARVTAKVTSRLTGQLIARGAGRAAVGGLIELPTELGQDLVPYILQDLAHEFDARIPDIIWRNGKDGVWDGYVFKVAQTAGAVLPLSILMAGGGSFRDARLAELPRTPDDHLLALGITPEHLAGIRSARGLNELDDAAISAWQARRPESPGAKAATDRLLAAENTRRQDMRRAEATGILPTVIAAGDGFTLIDSQTGGQIGRAETPERAVALAGAHARMREELSADETAYLVSQFQGAQAATRSDGSKERTRTEIRPELLLASQRAADDPGAELRILNQQRGREAVGEAPAGMGAAILGEHLTEVREGVREMTHRIYRGGSILTIFHEDGHKLLRRAQERGLLPRQEGAIAKALAPARQDTLRGMAARALDEVLRYFEESGVFPLDFPLE
ncbi:hypothetical protein [Luteolibacter sp. Populi]|uniref:hypothetical protein n=1 Tax=Luteolibacter sp. Populi TaxID=3230487 RepID=UPI003465EBD7